MNNVGGNKDYKDGNNTLYSNDNQDRKKIALFTCTTLIGGTIALTIPFVFTRSVLPYMATPARKVQAALQYTRQQQQCYPDKQTIFIDLGSGDGETVRQALLAGYDRAVGIELNRTLWLLSNIRRYFFWSKSQRQCSVFICRDFFRHKLDIQPDTQQATIMIFGVKPLMKALSCKLAQECPPDTFIMAYRFTVPTAVVTADENGSAQNDERTSLLLTADITYDKEEMRIYRVRSAAKSSR